MLRIGIVKRVISWFRRERERNWAPLAIWVALLIVTAVVIAKKAGGEHIDTADIVLIVLVVAGPLLVRIGAYLPFLGSVKLGDFEIKFRELTTQQARQQAEIEAAIRFLVKNFLNEYELTHLRNMESLRPFIVQPRPELEAELRRLLALGLIRRKPNTGVRALMRVEPHDVHQHLEITEAGRKFLEMAKAFEADQG
jgi:hypothetical protein